MAWKGGGAYPCGSGCTAWSRGTANIPADSRGNEKYIYQMPGSREGKGYFIGRFYRCSGSVSEGIEKIAVKYPLVLLRFFQASGWIWVYFRHSGPPFSMSFAACCGDHSLSVNDHSLPCPGGKDTTWKEKKKSPGLHSGSYGRWLETVQGIRLRLQGS